MGKKYDFSKMYDGATREEKAIVSKALISVVSKVNTLRKSIENYEKQQKQLIWEFERRIDAMDVEDAIKYFLKYQANKLYLRNVDNVNELKNVYHIWLGSIDFLKRLNNSELLKKNPYQENFKQVRSAVKKYKGSYAYFVNVLEELLTVKNISYLIFLKNRAEAFINKFDDYGIYHSIFEKGFAEFSFQKNRIGNDRDPKALMHNQYCIADLKENENSIFVVFVDNPMHKTKLEKKYGNCVIESKAYYYFFEDLQKMFYCLIDNLDISVNSGGIRLTLPTEKKKE